MEILTDLFRQFIAVAVANVYVDDLRTRVEHDISSISELGLLALGAMSELRHGRALPTEA